MSHPSYEFIHYDEPLTKSDSMYRILSFYLVGHTFLLFMLERAIIYYYKASSNIINVHAHPLVLQLYINKVTITHS